ILTLSPPFNNITRRHLVPPTRHQEYFTARALVLIRVCFSLSSLSLSAPTPTSQQTNEPQGHRAPGGKREKKREMYTNDALPILLATFAPLWLASLLVHLLWANLRAIVAATRFALRAYLVVAGGAIVLLVASVSVTQEKRLPAEPTYYDYGRATLPARAPLFFWVPWYAVALRGAGRDASRACRALAWALLLWALAQPDVVRLLAVAVADLVGEQLVLREDGEQGFMLGFGRSKWSFSPVEWAEY
ncbi:hypothetical protein F4775DRAFT_607435, partial [Biscogniauxia sp. FL1348]